MAQINDFMQKRFPDPVLSDHYIKLVCEYEDLGLARPDLLAEIIGGDRGFYSHIWEAMLYRHLHVHGFAFRQRNVTKAGQRGPDFGIVYQGQTIWIEAIVPSPEGIPGDYLRPPEVGEFRAGSFLHREILLRWTSALRDKRAKLQTYLEDGVIAETDCTVIAINGCRAVGLAYQDNGITQLPFAVEAVFPVGPLAVSVNRKDGRTIGDAYHTARYMIEKPNGAPVPTDNFLNPGYANVSAIMGCARAHMRYGLALAIVHNPHATVPLPHEILSADKEYVVDDEGQAYALRRVPSSSNE